jgi:hypothetical protein
MIYLTKIHKIICRNIKAYNLLYYYIVCWKNLRNCWRKDTCICACSVVLSSPWQSSLCLVVTDSSLGGRELGRLVIGTTYTIITKLTEDIKAVKLLSTYTIHFGARWRGGRRRRRDVKWSVLSVKQWREDERWRDLGRNFRCVALVVKCAYYLCHVHPSVRLSVRMYQLGPQLEEFLEIWFRVLFKKSVDKIQVFFFKSDKIIGHFTWRRK